MKEKERKCNLPFENTIIKYTPTTERKYITKKKKKIQNEDITDRKTAYLI